MHNSFSSCYITSFPQRLWRPGSFITTIIKLSNCQTCDGYMWRNRCWKTSEFRWKHRGLACRNRAKTVIGTRWQPNVTARKEHTVWYLFPNIHSLSLVSCIRCHFYYWSSEVCFIKVTTAKCGTWVVFD